MASLWTASVLALTACAPLPMTAQPTQAAAAPNPAARAELKAFPETLPGHQRHVIELPEQDDENAYKLELIGGQWMQVDCNRHGLSGGFEERDVSGWGYTYWVFQSQGQAFSTKMMCPPGTQRRDFVSAPPQLLRYNSKLPVVVFVPQGMDLRWRVWRAGEMQGATAP